MKKPYIPATPPPMPAVVQKTLYGCTLRYTPKTGELLKDGKPVIGKNANGQPRTRLGDFDVTVNRIAFELMGVYVDREQKIIHEDSDQSNTRWINMRVVDGIPRYKSETPAGMGWNDPSNPRSLLRHVSSN